MSVQSWYYWPLLGLLITQVVLSVNYQILICNIPMANTLLLLISLSFSSKKGSEGSTDLFYGICGCIAFLAVLFVNTTHALEMLTETMDGSQSEHHHGHDKEGKFPIVYFYVSTIDIVIKGFLLLKGFLPSFFLTPLLQVLFHFLASVVILLLNVLCHIAHLENSWWWEHLNPVSTVVITILSVLLLYPSYRFMKPYVFAEAPEFFDDQKLMKEIGEKYPNTNVNHIHVFKIWPKQSFEAIIHLKIKVNRTEENWSSEGEQTYADVSNLINNYMRQYPGNQRIIIEPRFVDESTPIVHWQSCTHKKCDKQERTCCGKKPGKTVA